MNEKDQEKLNELSKKLKAMDQQEAKTHPVAGTRRWFFRALTFGVGGIVLGKAVKAGAIHEYCYERNKPCITDVCGPERNICRNNNKCIVKNTCFNCNACIEKNECPNNICVEENICHQYNECTAPDGGSGCTKKNKCAIFNE